jgi:hypothetical protein
MTLHENLVTVSVCSLRHFPESLRSQRQCPLKGWYSCSGFIPGTIPMPTRRIASERLLRVIARPNFVRIEIGELTCRPDIGSFKLIASVEKSRRSNPAPTAEKWWRRSRTSGTRIRTPMPACGFTFPLMRPTMSASKYESLGSRCRTGHGLNPRSVRTDRELPRAA